MANARLFLNGVKTALSMNSPSILTGLGITSAVVTGVSAAKAAWDIRGDLEEEKEVTIVWIFSEGRWKRLIVPVGSLIATIACFVGINTKYGRLLAAATSVVTLREQELVDTKSAMGKILKKGDVEKVNQEKAQTILARNPQPDESFIIHTGKGNDLFFDNESKLYFRCDMQHIDQTINDINAALLQGQELRTAEVYSGWGFVDPPGWCEHIWMIPEQDMGLPFRTLDVRHTQAHVTTKGEAATILEWPDDAWSTGFFQVNESRRSY